jgi:hypothetical protein
MIIGIIEAKRSGPILPTDTRCLLPQPVFMQVLHNLLISRIQASLEERLQQLGCRQCILAGMGGNQVMDIVGTCQYVQELCIDNGSSWSQASADIMQFYDFVCPMATCRSLIAHGIPSATALFAARLHLAPCITITAGEHSACIKARVRGILTGSRSVSKLAMLPIMDVLL